MKVGYGWDSHEFKRGIPLKIGGVELIVRQIYAELSCLLKPGRIWGAVGIDQ